MPKLGTPPVIGIIGGSGLYNIDGLHNIEWRKINSPFGHPSDELMFAELGGQRVVFLPRHGRGHRILPSELNFRANIDVLKRVGVTEVLSLSAVGSLREDLQPGTFVIIDQFIDLTFARDKSFFGSGLVAHVSMAEPVCARLGDVLQSAIKTSEINLVRGGTYLTIEGPQFSSRAESELYRHWGCSVIGMTNMPEAKLAREAEMCYATVAMVTDFDCWHPKYANVSVDSIIEILIANTEKANGLIQQIVPLLSNRNVSCVCGCHTALDSAIITAPEFRDPKLVKKLSAVAGRLL